MLRLFKFVLSTAIVVITMAAGASDKPDFQVKSRASQLEFMPCADCHEYMDSNPERRVLTESPHFEDVDHAGADIWCTTCHSLNNRPNLVMLSGKQIPFENSYELCGQCHSAALNDWRHGAHGKRVGRWQGERLIYNCTECHNPHHEPGIKQRRPESPPGIRAGLQHRHRHQHDQQSQSDGSGNQ